VAMNRAISNADNSRYDNKTRKFQLSDSEMRDARGKIYDENLPLKELCLFAQTSKQYKAETAFPRLLRAAIHAAPAFLDAKDPTALASLVILKEYPELLFRKKMVTDHYDREIWASPYQIFLGAGDSWALKKVYEEIIPKIKNGDAQAEAQFKEQFPNCPWPLPKNLSEAMLYDDRNTKQIEVIVEQLAIVKQCIDIDPFTNNQPLDTTKLAVEKLCKLFQPKSGEVIRSGLHFPLAIIQEVYKTYDALQGHWSFFSLAVIKPALDALSTVDGQCCQGGLSWLDMKKGPSRRCHSSYQYPLGQPLSLTLVNDKDKRAAALVDPHNGDVLFVSSAPDYFDCYHKNGERMRGRRRVLLPLSTMCHLLENLRRTKAETYGSCYAATRREVNTLSQ
jgi:hypothetical protein